MTYLRRSLAIALLFALALALLTFADRRDDALIAHERDLTNNALRTCQLAHMINCHTELDSDGNLGVYGDLPPTALTSTTTLPGGHL